MSFRTKQSNRDWFNRQPPIIGLQTFAPSFIYSRLSHNNNHAQVLEGDDLSEYRTFTNNKSSSNISITHHSSDDTSNVHDATTETISQKIRKVLGGWRQAVIACAMVAALVLAVNIALTLLALFKFGTSQGIGTIYFGNCDKVKLWDTILHLVINILSTCLLSASNYTMQCLSSPTRSEVDVAHGKKKSLDIGIPSFKNLFHIARPKVWLWVGLVLSTLPLHLFWNAAIFTTLGAHDYTYLIVDESFLEGSAFQEPSTIAACDGSGEIPSFSSVYEAYKVGNYSERISSHDCIKIYGTDFLIDRRNMIAVTKPLSNMTMSPQCAYGSSQQFWNGSSVLAFSYQGTNTKSFQAVTSGILNTYEAWDWLCVGFGLDEGPSCSYGHAQDLTDWIGTWYLSPHAALNPQLGYSSQAYPIEYCYSEEKVPQSCRLQFVSYIMYVVIACNIAKVVCMILAARSLKCTTEPIFATIGDAVESYMERADETTKGWCLLDGSRLELWSRETSRTPADIQRYTRPARALLFAATSKSRWIWTFILCNFHLYVVLGTFFPAFLFNINIWGFGLGTADPASLWYSDFGSSGWSLIMAAFFANIFQLLTSAVYMLYNSIFTAQCGALEWSSYASPHGNRKPLRVSWPKGQQRSTYFLQLPYKYGLPLMAAQLLLHFFVSQSIFLVRVQWYKYDGSLNANELLTGVGYSSIGMIVTICVAATMVAALLLHTFRPLMNTIPIHKNHSVVISAMCHVNTRDSYLLDDRHSAHGDIASGQVTWGAVLQPSTDDDIGHCSFTRELAAKPLQGRMYR